MRIWLPTLWLFVLLSFSASAQRPNNEQQQKLEAQKLRLQKEIKQINQLLFKNRKRKKSVLSEVEDIDVKLQLREELIKINNQQANVINRRVIILSLIHISEPTRPY